MFGVVTGPSIASACIEAYKDASAFAHHPTEYNLNGLYCSPLGKFGGFTHDLFTWAAQCAREGGAAHFGAKQHWAAEAIKQYQLVAVTEFVATPDTP